MVQIIGPSPASQQAAQVAGQVGGNISKGLGLQQAQNLINEGQKTGNYGLIARGLGIMGMVSPEMSRAMGPMYENIVKGMSFNEVNPRRETPSQKTGIGQDKTPNDNLIQEQAKFEPESIVQGQGLNLGQFMPVDIGEIIDPEEAQQIIKKVAAKGGDIESTRKYIDEYNKRSIDFTQLKNSNVDLSFKQQERQLGREKDVREFIKEQVPQDTPESRKNLYYKLMDEEMPRSKDMTSAWQKVVRKAEDYERSIKEYPSKIKKITTSEKYSPLPEEGIGKPQAKILNTAAQKILETDPLAYPDLEAMYTQAGYSITEPARILKQLPPDISKDFREMEDYRDNIFPMGIENDAVAERLLENANKSQKKQVIPLAAKISKNWNEDLSLINMYSSLKKKGYFPENIYLMFNTLKSMGLPFSSQQETELTQLATPPVLSLEALHDDEL